MSMVRHNSNCALFSAFMLSVLQGESCTHPTTSGTHQKALGVRGCRFPWLLNANRIQLYYSDPNFQRVARMCSHIQIAPSPNLRSTLLLRDTLRGSIDGSCVIDSGGSR